VHEGRIDMKKLQRNGPTSVLSRLLPTSVLSRLLPTSILSRLLPASVLSSVSPCVLLSLFLLLLPCSSCGGSGGGGDDEQMREVMRGLQDIRARLDQNGGQGRARTGRTLSKEQLREVFQPLGDALGQVVEQQQVDREQWLAVVADVRRLTQIVEVGVAKNERAELAAMRARLDQVDERLKEQEQRSREAKEALIQALDAASGRLDGLLKELDAEGTKSGTKGAEEDKDKGEGKAGGKGEGTGTEKGTGKSTANNEEASAGYDFLVTFLLLSVVLLVCLVVFFPNRLRPVVPRVEFTARPDTGSDTGSGRGGGSGGTAVGAPELDHLHEMMTADAGHNAGHSAGHDAGKHVGIDLQLPRSVTLEVPCADPETAVERVAGFLSAEPRVLLQPEPELQARADALAVQFFLVPALAAEQQSRIEAAVRALAVEAAPGSAVGGKDNDLPAA
jgi:hypothetical protein